ncbi:hypothetical protein HA42_02270 [Pantoea deleyi]|nr:hypothetical protein HA42_02270 [Pantoea deleyi]
MLIGSYAALAGISRRTGSDFGQDRETTPQAPLSQALNPQGLNTGIVPHQSPTLERLMLQLTPGENRDDS